MIRRIIFILMAGLVLAVVTTVGSPEANAKQKVTLSVSSSKGTYIRGEAIQISLTVRNNGSAPVRISQSSLGPIRVILIKKDGLAVPQRVTAIDFDDNLQTLMEQSLQVVKSGDEVSLLPMTTSNDAQLGGQALRVVLYMANGNHRAEYYFLGAPGVYEVTLRYHYPASTKSGKSVFRQRTNSATAKFSVMP